MSGWRKRQIADLVERDNKSPGLKFECTLWYNDIDEFVTTRETGCVIVEIRATNFRTAELLAQHMQAKLGADEYSLEIAE